MALLKDQFSLTIQDGFSFYSIVNAAVLNYYSTTSPSPVLDIPPDQVVPKERPTTDLNLLGGTVTVGADALSTTATGAGTRGGVEVQSSNGNSGASIGFSDTLNNELSNSRLGGGGGGTPNF